MANSMCDNDEITNSNEEEYITQKLKEQSLEIVKHECKSSDIEQQSNMFSVEDNLPNQEMNTEGCDIASKNEAAVISQNNRNGDEYINEGLIKNNSTDSNCEVDQPESNESAIEGIKMDCESEKSNCKENFCFPTYCFDELIEITKSSKPFSLDKFLVGCKWSPDGTCLLTNCVDFGIRLFDLPSQLYNKQYWDRREVLPELQPSLKINEGGQIYDYDWYPFMTSWSPESCCFITTSLRAPIHLWDAYSGKIRATYLGYNRFDETDYAYSIKFSLNGEKIYCGYKNEIKIFDVSSPGRDFTKIDTHHVAGQTGILSCIAENPAVPSMFAVGSYKRTIGLYLESGDSVCLLNGQRRGVTHIMWSHDGIYLISGARKDNELLCWDMRNPGEVMCTMQRTVNTNQRIYFDLTPDGKYLISGNTNGEITCWDLNLPPEASGLRNVSFKFQAHGDCANGISIHRQLPLLATSSGQHHFPDIASDDEENNLFDVGKMVLRIENTVKLWWAGPLKNEDSN